MLFQELKYIKMMKNGFRKVLTVFGRAQPNFSSVPTFHGASLHLTTSGGDPNTTDVL